MLNYICMYVCMYIYIYIYIYIYSDKQTYTPTRHLEEEEILRKVDAVYQPEMFGYQDIALLPLRQPDQPLQDEVVRAWAPIRDAELRRAEEEAAAAERAANAEGESGDKKEGDETGEKDPGQADGEANEAGDGQNTEEMSEAKREAALLVQGAVGRLQPLEPDVPTFNAVVFAHPLAGGPRLARAIAKRHAVGVVNVQAVMDELIKEVCERCMRDLLAYLPI
jgi:hypothetical protein